MFLLNLGLKCLMAPVRISNFLYSGLVSVRCLAAVFISEKLPMLKSVSSAFMLFVNAPQSALF